ncbi:MAG TPA: alpha-L-arabinofuranosidase C-terminal domain-containing protein [Vicinamibacterales bacterium]
MTRVIVVLVALALSLSQAPARTSTGTITVDAARPGHAISPGLYGIFFEEISHAGDGGLYAELIQNRGFEDARLPVNTTLRDGSIVPERTPHFDTGRPSEWRMRWNVESATPAWTFETTGGASGSMRLVDIQPLTPATPHSLEVIIEQAGEGRGRVAVLNEGYWGINTVAGESYDLSLYARSDGSFGGPITASLESASGTVLASARVTGAPGASWTKYSTTLTASGTDPKARLALTFGSTGRVWLDFVSLFPQKTWKNRPNGLRPDLAELIAGLEPAFVRWPGGCFAEGISIDNRPQWKRSIGRLEDRPGTYSPWGYWSTDGFGYHEFLQFSEDLGAAALFVVNAGVSCSMRSGTYLDDEHLPALIQDALDAIEYAIGPPASTWGAVRAKNGHPAPFPLKYVEIGNEQRGGRYGERVALFYDANKEKYPQLKIALSSWIAGVDQRIIDAAGKIDIVDEHAYKPLHWAIENFDSFASYKRQGWDLYIGEFATNAGVGRGNVLAMLNDAAYMMSMEKNSDLVKMGSYAPLLENVNDRDWPVNMIHFDSSRSYARATYYANKLFAENLPTVNLPTTVDYRPAGPKPITLRAGVATHNTAAEYKDAVISRDGKPVYTSNFTTTADWVPEGRRGNWSVVDGVYRQDQEAVAWSFISQLPGDVRDFEVSLKARKLSGLEGFIIPVGIADGRRVQWNIGGWGNTRHAVQAADAVVGESIRGSIESGRWYDIRIEVRDRTLRGYLDGQFVMERTLPRVDKVLAIAGRDDRTGDIILKVVNSAPEAAAMTLNVVGAAPGSGTMTVLTSENPLDENTFEEPTKIVPETSPIAIRGSSVEHSFAPHSLSIIRLKRR